MEYMYHMTSGMNNWDNSTLGYVSQCMFFILEYGNSIFKPFKAFSQAVDANDMFHILWRKGHNVCGCVRLLVSAPS